DQEREEGVQARLDDEDEQDDDRDDRDRQEQPDRPIREDEFFHGGLQVVGAGSRRREPRTGTLGTRARARVPSVRLRSRASVPRPRAGPGGWGGGGWGSVVLRGGLRCRAELGEQLRHLGVGLVAVGDQLRGGLLVVVAEQSLAVLDAL